MPNWSYLVVSFLYYLGLALWIGGIAVLGAIVAPALFRTLDRPTAGATFRAILRRFSRLRLVALFLVVIGVVAKRMLWETHASAHGNGVWVLLRAVAVLVMALTIAHDIAVEKRMHALRERMGGDEPARIAVGRLHKRSELSMKIGLGAAIVALFFS